MLILNFRKVGCFPTCFSTVPAEQNHLFFRKQAREAGPCQTLPGTLGCIPPRLTGFPCLLGRGCVRRVAQHSCLHLEFTALPGFGIWGGHYLEEQLKHRGENISLVWEERKKNLLLLKQHFWDWRDGSVAKRSIVLPFLRKARSSVPSTHTRRL